MPHHPGRILLSLGQILCRKHGTAGAQKPSLSGGEVAFEGQRGGQASPALIFSECFYGEKTLLSKVSVSRRKLERSIRFV